MFGFSLLVVTLAVLFCVVVHAERLADISFEPPFNDVDYSGNRMINRQWRVFGSAAVNQNFIRLTPDRQSKRGAVWSRRPLEQSNVSGLLKFRISGQGKQFYGDGLALWIVTQGYYVEGELHAFQEKFTGIGVVFDTYKNTDSAHSHRDVSVLVNSGDQTLTYMTERLEGCNINVRYHAERADFNVKDSVALAKFIVTDSTFELLIDARNTGEWSPCVKLDKLDLPNTWLRHAHVGVTASTGQLADNHDVISLVTYSDPNVMESDAAVKNSKRFFDQAPHLPADERIARLELAVDGILSKFDFADHHNEHEFVTVADKLDNLEARLRQLVPDANQVKDIVKDETSDVKAAVEVHKQKLDKLNLMVDTIAATASQQAKQAAANAKNGGAATTTSGGGEWKLPFLILTLFVVGALIGAYMFYLHLVKKWKLP